MSNDRALEPGILAPLLLNDMIADTSRGLLEAL
jgi:hypothetical protein